MKVNLDVDLNFYVNYMNGNVCKDQGTNFTCQEFQPDKF